MKYFNADVIESKLNKASELGAEHTILIKPTDKEDEIVDRIIRTLGCQPTISLECSGAESSVRIAIKVNTLIYKYVYSSIMLFVGN